MASALKCTKDVSEARPEIVALKKKRQELCRRLSEVDTNWYQLMVNPRVGKNDIINSLLDELLAWMFHLAIGSVGPACDGQLHVKPLLMQISPRWRTTLLTLGVWTTIDITPWWNPKTMQEYVDRSEDCAVDVSTSWDGRRSSKLLEMFWIVLQSSYRWRSLFIVDTTFPQLLYANLGLRPMRYPRLLGDTKTPMLRRLKLLVVPDGSLAIPSTVSSLDLEFNTSTSEASYSNPVWSCVSAMSTSLTFLAFKVPTHDWGLEPDRTSLPLLESLALDINTPGQILRPIVVPGLKHFTYGATLSKLPSSALPAIPTVAYWARTLPCPTFTIFNSRSSIYPPSFTSQTVGPTSRWWI
ncbi:hypothetical protein V8B97DRAFT_2111856 [Scleroderma yunnanense]